MSLQPSVDRKMQSRLFYKWADSKKTGFAIGLLLLFSRFLRVLYLDDSHLPSSLNLFSHIKKEVHIILPIESLRSFNFLQQFQFPSTLETSSGKGVKVWSWLKCIDDLFGSISRLNNNQAGSSLPFQRNCLGLKYFF